jgi:hypothetical protein
VNIDEVTTVASVYALAQFMAAGGGANLGVSSTNSLGLANAFATVDNLVNVANGTAPGASLPSGATAPTAELNTLADLLATCVNSDGTTGECSSLFAAATPNGGSAPTNTIDAILDIAQNPGNSVSALYNLMTGTPPFQPTLNSAPNDWTVMVNYVGGGLNSPLGVAIDGRNNIWTGNLGGSPYGPSLSKFSPTGVALSPYWLHGRRPCCWISVHNRGGRFREPLDGELYKKQLEQVLQQWSRSFSLYWLYRRWAERTCRYRG